MEDVQKAIKLQNGLQVIYFVKDRSEEDHFNYVELVDQRINALDLLDHPDDYQVDPEKHLIVPKK